MQASSISCAVTRRGGIGLDVDELAPEHILAEQHLAHAPLEAPEAQLLAREPHRARVEARRRASIGTNSSRPPILAFSPVTGG